MNEQVNSLQSSFWFMVLLQTIGSMDMPGRGPRKMPSPRSFGAIIIAWGVLQLLADMGQERVAKTVGWIIVLAGMVLGPFGTLVADLFSNVGTSLATPITPTTQAPTTPYPN